MFIIKADVSWGIGISANFVYIIKRNYDNSSKFLSLKEGDSLSLRYKKRDPLLVKTCEYWIPVGPYKYLNKIKKNSFQSSSIDNGLLNILKIELEALASNPERKFYRDRSSQVSSASSSKIPSKNTFRSKTLTYKTKGKIEYKENDSQQNYQNSNSSYSLDVLDYFNYLVLNLDNSQIASWVSFKKPESLFTSLYTDPQVVDVRTHPFFYDANSGLFDEYISTYVNSPGLWAVTGAISIVLSFDNKGNFDYKIGSIHIPVKYYGFKFLWNFYPLNYINFFEKIPQFQSMDFCAIFHLENFGFGFCIKYKDLYMLAFNKDPRVLNYLSMFGPVIYMKINTQGKFYEDLHIIIHFNPFSYIISLSVMVYIPFFKISSKNQGLDIPTLSISGTGDELDRVSLEE